MKKLNKYQITKQLKIFESTVMVEKKKPFPLWIGVLTKIISAFVVIFLGDYIIAKCQNFFVEYVPNNEVWAVTMIALPMALFGIYLPLLISQKQKFSSVIFDETIRDLYYYTLQIGSFSYLFAMHAFANLLYWFLSFLSLDYTRLTASALFLTIDLLYLIIDAVYKLGISPSKLYAKYILQMYLSSTYHPQAEANYFKMISESMGKKGFETRDIATIAEPRIFARRVYEELYDEIQKMYLCAISNSSNAAEKKAIIEVFQKLSKLKLKKVNIIAVSLFLDLLPALYDSAMTQNDYCFIVSLTNSLLSLWGNTLEKLAYYQEKYCKEYAPLLNNQKNSTLDELQKIKKINNIFYDRLQIYFVVTTCIINKINVVVDKLGDCQLFDLLDPSTEDYKNAVRDGKAMLNGAYGVISKLKQSQSKN